MTRDVIAAAMAAHIRSLPEGEWQWWNGDGHFITEQGIDLNKVTRICTDYLFDLFGMPV